MSVVQKQTPYFFNSHFNIIILIHLVILQSVTNAIIYNKPTRCNSGSIVFINNYRYAVTVYSAPDDGRKGRPKHVDIPVVVNKHNTARVASCWFIIYYRLAAVTVYSAPDDGRKGRPKQVEHTRSC